MFELSPEWTSVWNLMLIAYWAAVIIILVGQDRDPSTTLLWILTLLVFPFVGIILYFFAGRDWRHIEKRSKRTQVRKKLREKFSTGRHMPYHDKARTYIKTRPLGLTQQVSRSIETQTTVPPTLVKQAEIIGDGKAYFDLLIEDLSHAKHCINIQYFIWKSDDLTKRITDVLIERIKAGVEVRILNDFFSTFSSRRDMFRLKTAGAKVEFDVKSIAKINYRNHRKITVIDGRVAHTGGFNIAEEYITGGARYTSWRDTGIRLEGPIVFQLQDLFAQRWFDVVYESLYSDRFFPPFSAEELAKLDESKHIVGQVSAHGAEDYWRSCALAYEEAIASSDHSVRIATPYYVPTSSMQHALINAALAGVEVQLMITGIPDKKIAWWAAFSYFEPLLKAGVKIHLYQTGFFHAKTIVIDDEICGVGTMNLDVRSLELHKELVVWLYNHDLAEQCISQFEHDVKNSKQINEEDLQKMNPLLKFRNSLTRLASNLL